MWMMLELINRRMILDEPTTRHVPLKDIPTSLICMKFVVNEPRGLPLEHVLRKKLVRIIEVGLYDVVGLVEV